MPEVSESPLRQGTKKWRAVPEVRQDCKAREAAQQERSRAHAGEPGSASSGVAVRSASCGPALAQTLSADTVEPGSASSSQAQVTPPASGRMAENAGARAAGIAASDVQNMNKADLRTLANSLGVTTRANRKNVDTLRAACGRVLQGQRGIVAYLQPAVASQRDLGLEVAGQVGGVAAPVSDSASAVEPCQTTVHKQSRIDYREAAAADDEAQALPRLPREAQAEAATLNSSATTLASSLTEDIEAVRETDFPVMKCSPCPLCGRRCTSHTRGRITAGLVDAYCTHGLPRMGVHEWTTMWKQPHSSDAESGSAPIGATSEEPSRMETEDALILC